MIRLSLSMSLFLRSFLVQGSWNYRTLMGTGIAWALSPVHENAPGDPSEVSTNVPMDEPFNTHPYLACIALGAFAHPANPHGAGLTPDESRRFWGALGSPLGSLGDRLVWGAWRPLCIVLAMFVAALGAQPAIVVALFLMSYNLLHLWLRGWGLVAGLRCGFGVSSEVERVRLGQKSERARSAGLLIIGGLLGLLAQRTVALPGAGLPWTGAAAALLLAGAISGQMLRRWTPAVLVCLITLVLLAAPILVGSN